MWIRVYLERDPSAAARGMPVDLDRGELSIPHPSITGIAIGTTIRSGGGGDYDARQ